MSDSFRVAASHVTAGGTAAMLFTIGFDRPADNTVAVVDAIAALDAAMAPDAGGALALVNGPASLPVIVAIAHKLAHRFGAMAIYDPKLSGYVVAVCHGPGHSVGDLIPVSAVRADGV